MTGIVRPVRSAHALVLALAGVAALACSRDAPAPSSAAPSSAAPSGAAPSGAASGAPAVVVSVLPEGPTREMVLGRCTICHDESYLPQQRLSLEGWQKTVAKMQGFGAPVAAEEVPVIAAYLSASFPASAPDVVHALVAKPTSGFAPRAAP